MAKARGFARGYRPSDPLVYFRRIPGTRVYYDPRNERRFSEHFVQRKYRPSRTASERQAIREDAKRVATRRARSHANILSHYRLKLDSEGVPWDNAARQRFSYLYTRLELLRRESALLQAQANVQARDRMLGPRREYARVLTELGRRPEGATYLVGTSPEGIVATMAQRFTGG